MRNFLLSTAAAAATLALGLWSWSSNAQDPTDQQLGNVHFETSCNEVAQRRFDRAMRYSKICQRQIINEKYSRRPTLQPE